METSLIADTVATIATKNGLGFAKFLMDRRKSTFSSDQPSSAAVLHVSALIFPLDTVAPPPVKSNHVRTAPTRLARKARRTRRRSKTDGGADDDCEDGRFYGGGDGPFGGGGGGGGGGSGGGGGGNFDGFEGFNWDEPSPATPSDPAFDFIYEVLCWIVFSNCLHFAFKKVVRIVADGVADPAREKASIC